MENKLYETIIEDIPVAYAKYKGIKQSGKYIDLQTLNINKSYAELFNSTKNDLINNKMSELTDKKFENLDKLLNKAITNKKVTTIEYSKNIDANFNIDIYHGENDEFHFIFSKLSPDSNKLSSILKNSPFAAWIKNRDGVYVDVNKQYEILTEKSKTELLGKTDYELFIGELADQFRKRDDLVINKNQLVIYEEHIDFNLGERKYYQTSKWPYVDKHNNVLGTVGISMEITDKVQIIESIKNNDRIFEEISNNIEDILIIIDNEKALYISPAFEKTFGYSPKELYNDIHAWHNHNDYIEFLEEPKDYSYDKISIDTFRVIKEGKYDKWITCKFVPVFDEYGNIIKKVGIMSDITSSKKIQEQLEQLRLDFFANISHELRTPINLILSCMQVLKLRVSDLDSNDSAYIQKYHDIINQNGLRLLKLVNNLIDTTRIDDGHFPYNPQNNDIISFVENICLSVSQFIEQNQMTIIFDTNVEEKIVSFDLDNMERIVLNLLSNAIKFNKPNGTIEVNILCEKDIKISVKDNGIGIPREKIDSIFGRFEQVKRSIKKDAEGSGIGLSLVKSLVEMHNGSLSVTSKIDYGSEFTICLPDVLSSVNSNKEPSVQPTNINMMRVEFSDIYM